MRYLLDTHVLLWARSLPDKLSSEAVAVLESPESELYVSMATLWECAIKSSIGRLDVPTNFYQIVARDYTTLGMDVSHMEAYANLPMHHRDPFDRLLVVQAQLASLILITRDSMIAKYDVPVVMA